jgi:cytochrome b561
MLAVGAFSLARTPNGEAAKLDVLEWHMAGGMLILALMLARLAVRLVTAKPAAASTGRAGADRLARLGHWSFYLLVVAMAATGYATGLFAGLPAIVFQRSGAPLPDFAAYPTFTAHGVLAAVLAALIGLHVAAALYHHLVRRDGLFRRMALGSRTS